MNTKRAYLVVIGIIALLQLSPELAAQSNCQLCRPPWSTTAPDDTNVCEGTGSNPNDFCTCTIVKRVTYEIFWPDGFTEYSEQLSRSGKADCRETCQPGGFKGAPYGYKECWPPFYTPTIDQGYFRAEAEHADAVRIPQYCGPLGATYTFAINCTTVPYSLDWVSKTHECECCESEEICGNGKDDNCDGLTDQVLCGEQEEAPPGCDCASSPIVLKWNPGVIRLTNSTDGVEFDLNADGVPEQTAWTDPDETAEGWLALDVNSNGIIDNGSELFGNATRFPGGPAFTNGFQALEYLDKPERGGNFDGVIDTRDTVFQQLLLWVDRNHNGFSEPEELLRFSDHFQAIEWSHQESRRRDRYGNLFRWRANSYTAAGRLRLAWDVILLHQ